MSINILNLDVEWNGKKRIFVVTRAARKVKYTNWSVLLVTKTFASCKLDSFLKEQLKLLPHFFLFTDIDKWNYTTVQD
jgi:hypothetical protein